MVALHRRTGAVEVYGEPQLRLDEEWFRGDPAFGQFDLAVVGDREFPGARCDIDTGWVDTHLEFVDDVGRTIEVRSKYPVLGPGSGVGVGPAGRRAAGAVTDVGAEREADRRADRRAVAKPSPSLVTPAPLQSTPITLRFLLMHEFRVLPRSGSELVVAVDGRTTTVKPLVFPLKTMPYTQARSGANLLLAGLSPAHQHRRLGTPDGAHFERGNLVEVECANSHGRFAVHFVDPLPNPGSIVDGGGSSGRFVVKSSLGNVADGGWALRRDGDNVMFSLHHVRQDWTPPLHQPTRLALRQLRRMRRRNLRWDYSAVLQSGTDGWTSTGSWTVTIT